MEVFDVLIKFITIIIVMYLCTLLPMEVFDVLIKFITIIIVTYLCTHYCPWRYLMF